MPITPRPTSAIKTFATIEEAKKDERVWKEFSDSLLESLPFDSVRSLRCPLTSLAMREPFVGKNLVSYEKAELEKMASYKPNEYNLNKNLKDFIDGLFQKFLRERNKKYIIKAVQPIASAQVNNASPIQQIKDQQPDESKAIVTSVAPISTPATSVSHPSVMQSKATVLISESEKGIMQDAAALKKAKQTVANTSSTTSTSTTAQTSNRNNEGAMSSLSNRLNQGQPDSQKSVPTATSSSPVKQYETSTTGAHSITHRSPISIPRLNKPKFRIQVMGGFSTGKSNLIFRYADNRFYEQTLSSMGGSYRCVEENITNSESAELKIWESQYSLHMTGNDFSKLDAIILAVDLTDNARDTFNLASILCDRIIEHTLAGTPILLIATKKDSGQRIISDEEVIKFAAGKKLLGPMFTSAKTGEGIANAFKILALKLYESKQYEVRQNDIRKIAEHIKQLKIQLKQSNSSSSSSLGRHTLGISGYGNAPLFQPSTGPRAMGTPRLLPSIAETEKNIAAAEALLSVLENLQSEKDVFVMKQYEETIQKNPTLAHIYAYYKDASDSKQLIMPISGFHPGR